MLRAALRDIARLKGVEAAYAYLDSALQSAQRGRRQVDSLLANCQAAGVVRDEQVANLALALVKQRETTEAYISDLQSAKAALRKRKFGSWFSGAGVGAVIAVVAVLLLK